MLVHTQSPEEDAGVLFYTDHRILLRQECVLVTLELGWGPASPVILLSLNPTAAGLHLQNHAWIFAQHLGI